MWLSLGSLVFTTTAYYLLKNYLVEWGCRRFLKGRVRLESDKKTEGVQNGHTHAVNGVSHNSASGEGDGPQFVSKGDMAEVAQL